MSNNLRAEEFKLITGKKCRKISRKNKSDKFQGDYSAENISQDSCIKKLEKIRSNICVSEYFQSALSVIKSLLYKEKDFINIKLVCFGIGSFTNCPTSLHQLAFILEIINHLDINLPEFYDPILTTCDKNILNKFHCILLPENLEGKYTITTTTILYLPHCPKQLTNNFLWHNWNSENLQKTILICNSFNNLLQNIPKRLLETDAKYIVKINEYTNEIILNNCYEYDDIFNDTSVHVFRKEILPEMHTEFWHRESQPIYNDLELIKKEDVKM